MRFIVKCSCGSTIAGFDVLDEAIKMSEDHKKFGAAHVVTIETYKDPRQMEFDFDEASFMRIQ